MKKISLFLVVFVSVFIFSCKKEAEVKQQEQPANTNIQPLNTNVPHFDETNSTKVTWDQLPSELRNAVEIDTREDKKLRVGSGVQSTAWSVYSYYIGPWGGWGGSPYYIYPPNGSRIYAMAIRSGAYVDRLTIWYQRADGTIYMGGDRGGNGGTFYLQFFASDEYIYYVGGRSGAYVDRLSIYTNKKWFSYGGNGGAAFYAGVPYGYQVLGFWGRSGSYIDQIGFYVYTR